MKIVYCSEDLHYENRIIWFCPLLRFVWCFISRFLIFNDRSIYHLGPNKCCNNWTQSWLGNGLDPWISAAKTSGPVPHNTRLQCTSGTGHHGVCRLAGRPTYYIFRKWCCKYGPLLKIEIENIYISCTIKNLHLKKRRKSYFCVNKQL